MQNQIRFAFKLPYDLTARGIKNNYLTRMRPLGKKLYKKFGLDLIFYLKLDNNGVFLLISKRDRDRRVHERTRQNAEE